MLEPLIVLTVLNCFFMFSSTATTCALWWQYRSHRCCFRKDTAHQAARHALSKLRSNCHSKACRKPGSTKQDNLGSGVDRSKSNSTVNRDGKSRRSSKQRRSSSLKYLAQSNSPSDGYVTSMGDINGNSLNGNSPKGNSPKGNSPKGNSPKGNSPKGNSLNGTSHNGNSLNGDSLNGEWDFEDRRRMSEGSQTGNDVRQAVVMEYSTVQKIVQILDDDTDLATTKLVIRDLQAKQHAEEKRLDYEAEAKLEGPPLTIYAVAES